MSFLFHFSVAEEEHLKWKNSVTHFSEHFLADLLSTTGINSIERVMKQIRLVMHVLAID